MMERMKENKSLWNSHLLWWCYSVTKEQMAQISNSYKSPTQNFGMFKFELPKVISVYSLVILCGHFPIFLTIYVILLLHGCRDLSGLRKQTGIFRIKLILKVEHQWSSQWSCPDGIHGQTEIQGGNGSGNRDIHHGKNVGISLGV